MKMSSTSEERSEESDSSAEEEEDDVQPLYALAPIGTQEKSPKDVSASPAFQCLDEVRKEF